MTTTGTIIGHNHIEMTALVKLQAANKIQRLSATHDEYGWRVVCFVNGAHFAGTGPKREKAAVDLWWKVQDAIDGK